MFGCCCQSGGVITNCFSVRRMYAWYEQAMYINTSTCGMFRKQTEVLNETAPDYFATQTTVSEYLSPYPFPATVTITYADPNFAPRFLCNESSRTYYDRYSNASGYGYKYTCSGRDSVWTYDVTYSNPFTIAELEAKQRNLEAYTVANWDLLVSQFALQVKLDANYQPLRSGTSITAAHYCTSNTQDTLNAGNGRGWAGTSTSLYPLSPSTNEWRPTFIRFVSWFSKVRLTRNYRLKRFNVATSTSPGYCSSITPMRFFGGDGDYGTAPSAVFVCSNTTLQNYSDGYDQNNQPRSIIFGPLDTQNHMVLVECLV